MVNLDLEALEWALAVLKDNRYDVEKRGQMTEAWLTKYQDSEGHLSELIRKAKS
jgi:hypothetical protein